LPATLSVVSTIEAIITEKPELERFYERSCIVSSLCCCVSNLGLSPNGKWAVFFNIIDGSAGLSIVNIESKQQWDISYYDITGTYGGDVTVRIEHWSRDGHYLYVSPQMAGSGGLFWFWRDYIQLIQINLETGTWINTNMGSAFSFSPDDRFIAYRRAQEVVIHELQTGQERTFTVPSEYGAFGRFVWSPDGKQIIFIGSSVDELESDELFDQANGFTLFLLDTENMKVQAIIEKDERYLYPIEWQAPNIVLLERLYQVASDGSLHYDGVEKYKLDLETNDISKYESP
jgi:Tol biopolymer transport system component